MAYPVRLRQYVRIVITYVEESAENRLSRRSVDSGVNSNDKLGIHKNSSLMSEEETLYSRRYGVSRQ